MGPGSYGGLVARSIDYSTSLARFRRVLWAGMDYGHHGGLWASTPQSGSHAWALRSCVLVKVQGESGVCRAALELRNAWKRGQHKAQVKNTTTTLPDPGAPSSGSAGTGAGASAGGRGRRANGLRYESTNGATGRKRSPEDVNQAQGKRRESAQHQIAGTDQHAMTTDPPTEEHDTKNNPKNVVCGRHAAQQHPVRTWSKSPPTTNSQAHVKHADGACRGSIHRQQARLGG